MFTLRSQDHPRRARPPAARRPDRVTRALIACGLIAAPVFAAFVLAATWATPGYSHVSETISQLGADGRPRAGIIDAGFVVSGLLTAAFAIGVYRWIRGRPASKAALAALLVNATGIVLSGVFADNPATREALTTENRLHHLVGQVSFVAGVTAMVAFAFGSYSVPGWRRLAAFTLFVVFADVILAAVFYFDLLSPWRGALQRTFFAVALLWTTMVSVRALTERTGPVTSAASPETV
jgi:hypothetical membrane protein